MSKGDLFEKENRVLAEAIETSKTFSESAKDGDEYVRLTNHYKELLDQTKVLAKVGDKLHKKINKTNELIHEKNRKLEETLEMLLTEKAGRQAMIITFIFFLVIFILTEVFLDPKVENWAHATFPNQSSVEVIAGLSIKIFIALLLRPIEYFIEKILIKKARMKRLNGLLNQR